MRATRHVHAKLMGQQLLGLHLAALGTNRASLVGKQRKTQCALSIRINVCMSCVAYNAAYAMTGESGLINSSQGCEYDIKVGQGRVTVATQQLNTIGPQAAGFVRVHLHAATPRTMWYARMWSARASLAFTSSTVMPISVRNVWIACSSSSSRAW